MTARTMYDVVSHYTADSGALVWRLSGVDQVTDLYEARRAGAVVPIGSHNCGAAHEDNSDRTRFCGCRPADAIRMARDGWPDGERKLADALKKADALAMAGAGSLSGDSLDLSALPDLVPSTSPAARWDLGDYMTGAPDLYREQVPPPSRVIRLILDASVTCDTTAEKITLAAGALVAVVQRLQAQGVTVSLDVVYGGRGCDDGGRGGLFFIPLLAEGRAMDLDRLAFWLAHPGAFRRFGFALYELGMPQLSGGYGSILELFPAGQAAMQEELAKDPTAIFLPPLQRVIFHAYHARDEKTPTGQALKEWAEAVQGGAA